MSAGTSSLHGGDSPRDGRGARPGAAALTGSDPVALELIRLFATAARGPRREGLYAVWLLLRVAQDHLLDPPLAERALRRRVAALEARLSSLTVPSALRRALPAALLQLREAQRRGIPTLLSTLVAPTRDALGSEAAELVHRAARAARQAPA